MEKIRHKFIFLISLIAFQIILLSVFVLLYFSKKDGVYSSAYSAPLCVGGKALLVMDNSFLMDVAYAPDENYFRVNLGKYYNEGAYIKLKLNDVKESFIFKPSLWGGIQKCEGECDILGDKLYKYCYVYEAIILVAFTLLISLFCQVLLYLTLIKKRQR